MADAAARPGKKQRSIALVAERHPSLDLSAPALRIEPGFVPRSLGTSAGERDAIMQPKRPLLPKLDFSRCHAIAGPMSWSGHRADRIFCRVARYLLLECQSAFERRRLLARPSSDLRHARACGKIRVGFSRRDRLDRSA